MSESRTNFDACSCGLAPEGGAGDSYNEEAFHHLVAVERKRTARSNRPFVLLLLDFKKEQGGEGEIAPSTATKLFAGLERALRETDFVGWYRHGRVVGAVLTHFEDRAMTQIARVVSDRLHSELRRELPAESLRRIQVRAYRRPPNFRNRS